MKINLKRPLVVFDLETTGIDINSDKIVSITLLRIEPNNSRTLKTYIVNPGVLIPPHATAIHGITNEDVKDKPLFKDIASSVVDLMEGADLAGFNSNRFDLPLLAEELLRAEIDFNFKNRKFIDVQVIFHKKEPRDLCSAYRFYCNKDLVNAHSSEADTLATFEILEAQIEKYPDLSSNIDELSKFSTHHKFADLAGHIIFNENDEEVFNFGKYKGQTVESVFEKDAGYFGWILSSKFPQYTKKVLTAIKLKSKES